MSCDIWLGVGAEELRVNPSAHCSSSMLWSKLEISSPVNTPPRHRWLKCPLHGRKVVTLWSGTGSPCLLTLVLPLDRGLIDGIPRALMSPHLELTVRPCWALSPFLRKKKKKSVGLTVLLAPPCSAILRRERQGCFSEEWLFRGNATFGAFCSLLRGEDPFLPSAG